MNRELRLVLKAVLLQQLNVPEAVINIKMYSNAAFFYMDFESNPYSLHYKVNSADTSI